MTTGRLFAWLMIVPQCGFGGGLLVYLSGDVFGIKNQTPGLR